MKCFFLLAAAASLFSCAYFNPPQKSVATVADNPRIVQRDLARLPAPEKSPEPVIEENPAEVPPIRPSCTILFENDSLRRFDSSVLDTFLAKVEKDAHLLVIGHSHGNSAVGTARLATGRADTIRRYLKQQGFENLHVLARWSNRKVDYGPSRGVQVTTFENLDEMHLTW